MERNQSEARPRESEERFAKIFASGPVGIYITRLSNGQYVDVNEAYCGLLGYEREELLGHTTSDLKIWADPEARAAVGRELRAEKRHGNFDLEIVRKDGTIRSGIGSTDLIEIGGERYLLGMLVDITERKRAQQGREKLLARERAVHALAELHAARIRRLQAITAALSASHTVEEIAKTVLEYEMPALGAVSGAVVRLNAAGTHLEHVVAIGYEPAMPAYPMDLKIPFVDAVKKGEAIFIESPRQFAKLYPGSARLDDPYGSKASITLPLIVNGRALGALGFGLAESRKFDATKRSFMLTLAQECAQAMERAALYDETRRMNAELQERVAARTRELEDALVDLRRLSIHTQSVREEERLALGRELHDDLGQYLSALRIDLGALKRNLKETQGQPLSRESVLAEIVKTLGLVDASIQSMRKLVHQLRDETLHDLGLVPALDSHVEQFQATHHLDTQLRTELEDNPVEGAQALALYRIAQEALTNVAKHAQANHVEVTLQRQGQDVVLEVADDGKGIALADRVQNNHFGLLNMRERARQVGGTLQVVPAIGGGTRVIARVPAKP
jgi:PAS domain S-box-containing protein